MERSYFAPCEISTLTGPWGGSFHDGCRVSEGRKKKPTKICMWIAGSRPVICCRERKMAAS
jgi:hypothetical protein